MGSKWQRNLWGIAGLTVFTVACLWLTHPQGARRPTPSPGPAPLDVWAVEESPSRRLALLLQPRSVHAEELQLMASPRDAALAGKLKENMQKDPGWWLEKMRDQEPGQPLPYDPRLGVSEAEYQAFLTISERMKLTPVREVDLTITTEDGRTYIIKGLPEVGPLQIDVERLTLRTLHGEVSEPITFAAMEGQKVTGRWNGYSWKTGRRSLLTGIRIRISLGQLVDSRQVLLELRINDLETKKYLVDYLVRFPGPTEEGRKP